MTTNPCGQSQGFCQWSSSQSSTAGATATTQNKRNAACGKHPGKLNRNKYSTVTRYICSVNITRFRKSRECFHGFKSTLNTNCINTFSAHTLVHLSAISRTLCKEEKKQSGFVMGAATNVSECSAVMENSTQTLML